VCDPMFTKIKDAYTPKRTIDYMSYPIILPKGDLFLNLQVVSKKKKNSAFSAGFSMVDQVFTNLVGSLLQMKLHQIMAHLDQKKTEREVIQTIKISSAICTQRSYADFILKCRKELPEFFGFEGIGILFRDTKSN